MSTIKTETDVENNQTKHLPTLSNFELAMLLEADFYSKFTQVTKRDFIENGNNKEVVRRLCLYFSKAEEFLSYEGIDISGIISPFSRGIALMGDNGTGKTEIMRTFSSILGNSTQKYNVKSTKKIELEYSESENKKSFLIPFSDKYIWTFDDLLYENSVNIYGSKVNVMEEILISRYDKNLKTHITFNTPIQFDGTLDHALHPFWDKYGRRVYDRMFSMFNFIEVTGKSLRK